MRRALFICTGNSERSPTAEAYFRNWKGVWETRSAGTSPNHGGAALSQELVDWADLIICMEEEHRRFLEAKFDCPPSKAKVAGIADQYIRNDPRLIELLDHKVRPMLEASELN